MALALLSLGLAARCPGSLGDAMTQLNLVFVAGFIAASAAASASAQQTQPKDSSRKSHAIPADARPPKGMCRIWLDNVPPAQQPAATDCSTAVKNRPQNAHVIFGDDFADSSKATKLPPNIKGFTGSKSPVVAIPTRPPE
jgi:hypothetical protein